MKMTPNTDDEWDNPDIPHIVLTSGSQWDPTVLDHSLTDRDDWYNTLKELDDGLYPSPFDERGNYRERQIPVSPLPLTPDLDPDIEADYNDLRICFAQCSQLNGI